MFEVKTQMTPRERILTTLSLKEPDKVPMNLGGFNRQAYKQFKQITGCDEPNDYFDVPVCVKPVFFKSPYEDTHFYAKYHQEESLAKKITFNDWGTGFVAGSDPAFDHFIAPLTHIDDVRNEVKQRIETVGTHGGFVISPIHSIAPEVPYENLFAFVEAAKEYGGYCDK